LSRPAERAGAAALADGVRAGDRRALARAVTLVESRREDDRVRAVALLDAVHAAATPARRVGISGAPGVGKSTFIEVLGIHLVDAGHRVAVLAVDPTSSRSGGSILGDKTRMSELARRPEAFIRPSPSGGDLGGVAARTGEAILLCEAAGYDVVLVETVGVGQSEVAVADLVDTFVLLVAPGGGDDLQGVKRGIMELADLVVVTKADGDLAAAARRAEADYRHAARFLRRRLEAWEPRVLAASAVEGRGIDAVWAAVDEHHATLVAGGHLDRLRADQAVAAFWREVERGLLARLRAADHRGARLAELEAAVAAGATPAPAAAWRALHGDGAGAPPLA
jgi:LAO/AO transport system kinase